MLSWSNFRRALKAANSDLVFEKPNKEFTSAGCMVYLRCSGGSEDDYVEGTTLKQLLAIASPSFFRLGCPKQDVVEIIGGKKIWFRGYNNFFRQLLKIKYKGNHVVKNIDAMKAWLPSDALSRIDCATFKREWMESLRERPSDFEKRRKWLKDRSKPIEGNGMPIGWQPGDPLYA